MNKKPFINIIVPAYNEEPRIETSIRALIRYLRESSFPYPYAITIVNNGSTDKTATCVARLSEEYPDTVVSLTLSEKGKGRAVKRGWHEQGDIMVFMDADLSSDLACFRSLVEPLVADEADIAIGNRLGPSSQIHDRRALRSFASRVYNMLVRLVFATGLSDHQCGFKAIRKEVYERIAPYLRDDGWFFDTELLVIATRLRYRVREIDIRWRDDRRSKVSLAGTSWEMISAMFLFQEHLMHLGLSIPRDRVLHLLGQIMRFCVSGAFAAAVNLSMFWALFSLAHVNYLFDVAATAVVVFFVSFVLQKFWTFKNMDRKTMYKQLFLYTLSALATVIVNLALLYFLVEKAHMWPIAAQFLSLLLIACINFFVYKSFIFQR